VAQAAEPQAYWSPGLEALGAAGLVAGEFDGHDGLDVIATYNNGEALGLAVKLSGAEGETWALLPATTEGSLQLRTGQWDSDAELEILVGLPLYSSNVGKVGAAWVLDFSGQITAPAALEDLQVFAVEGTDADTGFGTDIQLLDCNEAPGVEVLIAQPGAGKRVPPSIWAMGGAGDAAVQAVGAWQLSGEGDLPAFGLNLHITEQKQSPVLALSACESPYSPGLTCQNRGVLMVLPADLCTGTMSINLQSATATNLPQIPQGLHDFAEGSTALLSGLVWAAPTKKSMVDLETGTKQALSSTGDAGAFVQNTAQGVVQTWVASSGAVWQIAGQLEKSDVESVEGAREHVLSTSSIGQRLVSAGDRSGNGCEDVLSTSASGDALYLLPGCDAQVPDTGDTGRDTGKDTGGKDTGEGPSDTGEDPCEQSFGWACAVSAGPPGGAPKGALGLSLLSLVFCRRRREPSA
jgi:MYXO-CTERM domain-containing protein